MRKKFYRLAAIMMAVNMMSFTVFSTGVSAKEEDTKQESDSGDDGGSDSGENKDNGSSDSGSSDGGSSDSGSSDGGSSDSGSGDSGSSDSGSGDSGSGDSGSGDSGSNDSGSGDSGSSDSGSSDGGSGDSGNSDSGSGDSGNSDSGSGDSGSSDSGSGDSGSSDGGSTDSGSGDSGSSDGGSGDSGSSDSGSGDSGSGDSGSSDSGSSDSGNGDSGSSDGGSGDSGSSDSGSGDSGSGDSGSSDSGSSDSGSGDSGSSDSGSGDSGSSDGGSSDSGSSDSGSNDNGGGSDQSGSSDNGGGSDQGGSSDNGGGSDQSGNSDNGGGSDQSGSADSGSGSDQSGSADNGSGSNQNGSTDTGSESQDAGNPSDNTRDSGQKDTSGDAPKAEDNKEASTDTGSSDQKGNTENKTDSDKASDSSSTAAGDTKDAQTDVSGKSDKDSGSESKPSAGSSSDADSSKSGSSAQDSKKEAPTDEEIEEMLNDTKRRTAVNNQDNSSDTGSSDSGSSSSSSGSSSSSWSNDGEIKDVMGIKADVQGDTVVISYKTKHTSDWDYNYGNNPITINYANGNSTGNNNTIIFDWNGEGIHGDNWSSIDGVTITKSSDQSDTEIVTMSIPASWFESMDFTVSAGDYTAQINGTPIAMDEAVKNAVYEGISLDGTFNDWDAVQKSTLNEPNDEHCVESVAWVIDQDYVYIYIKDDGSNSATWAGPNHNGKYAITTDLGRTLVFQLTEDGAIVGADGAVSNHTGSQWEIAIPASSLPQNNGGLSFGLYLTDSTLDGYGDVAAIGSDTGISYDGLYGDWDNYPHQEIQYATAGTHEIVPDGEAAIYVDDNVYGHCETRMPAHLEEKGGEYTQAVSVIANDDWSHALLMRLVTVDSAGNINWNPDRDNLENGSYEYYIFGTDAWAASSNINNLAEADVCYGKATVTLTEGRHDMEWYVDSAKLAARYGLAETDLKKVSSQYGRIGQELITSAGASSGPYAGAGMCIMSALVPFVLKKKFRFE